MLPWTKTTVGPVPILLTSSFEATASPRSSHLHAPGYRRPRLVSSARPRLPAPGDRARPRRLGAVVEPRVGLLGGVELAGSLGDGPAPAPTIDGQHGPSRAVFV